jgi:hypothetical protein
MELQRASRINESKLPRPGNRFYEIGPAEHRSGMRMRIMPMVGFVVNVGEESRDLRLAIPKIQLQQLYELLRMQEDCALQILCPLLVDQPDTGMGKKRAPYVIFKDAEQFGILDVFLVLLPHFIDVRQHRLVHLRGIFDVSNVQAGRKDCVYLIILAHKMRPGPILDSISDHFKRVIMICPGFAAKGEFKLKRVLGTSAITMLLLISLPLPAQNDSDAMQQLLKCREFSDIEKRAACYDDIGEVAPIAEAPAISADEVAPIAEAPAIPAEMETAAAAVVTTAAMDAPEDTELEAPSDEPADDIGLPKSEDELVSIRTTVVRCGQANDYRFYFYLDNGQVWKYLGGDQLRYRNCNTPATINEDGLGFKLKMDGKSSLRVQRVK